MPDAKIDRRNFIKGATMAGAAAQIPAQKKMIGIQVGAISFLDEGVEQVLDIFQQRANVNTLFLAVFTYGRGIAGRQVPGQPLPDHGKQEYDLNFHGGNFATPHPQYYKDTALKAEDTRAPDYPGRHHCQRGSGGPETRHPHHPLGLGCLPQRSAQYRQASGVRC